MSDEIQKQPPVFIVPTELPPHRIGFVLDGVVQDAIWVHDRFAAILLSDPIIINMTGTDDESAPALRTFWDGTKLTDEDDNELTVTPAPPFDGSVS
jgi:hypothetical protein